MNVEEALQAARIAAQPLAENLWIRRQAALQAAKLSECQYEQTAIEAEFLKQSQVGPYGHLQETFDAAAEALKQSLLTEANRPDVSVDAQPLADELSIRQKAALDAEKLSDCEYERIAIEAEFLKQSQVTPYGRLSLETPLPEPEQKKRGSK